MASRPTSGDDRAPDVRPDAGPDADPDAHPDASPPRGTVGDRSQRAADLAAHLAAHAPADDVEATHLDRIRTALATFDDAFAQEAGPVHVTGSAIVLPTDGAARTVLHHHKRLHRWLQPGGHVDAGEAAHQAARREVHEETGLEVSHPAAGPTLVHVHVHDGGRGHVHLDTRWLLLADPAQSFAPGEGESVHVRWVDEGELADMADETVTAAVRAAQAVHPG